MRKHSSKNQTNRNVRFAYSPFHVTRYKQPIYLAIDEPEDHVSYNIKSEDLIVAKYMTEQKKWTIDYYTKTITRMLSNKHVEAFRDKVVTLDKEFTYFGFIHAGDIHLVQARYNEHPIVVNENFLEGNDYANVQLPNGVTSDDHDKLIMDPKGGFLCINSTDPLDIISVIFKRFSYKKDLYELLSKLFEPDHIDVMNIICSRLTPIMEDLAAKKYLPEYPAIFDQIRKHDRNWYDESITIFNDDLANLVNMFNKNKLEFFGTFITGFRKYIIGELLFIHHRYSTHNNDELNTLKESQPDSPYFKLFYIINKGLHKYKPRRGSRRSTNTDKMYKRLDRLFFNHNEQNYIYGMEYNFLLRSLMMRHSLLDLMYKSYLASNNNHLKVKNPTKYTYFPFKVFSVEILIMEMILMQQMN